MRGEAARGWDRQVSKGSKRRKENTAQVEANWPFAERKRYGVWAVHESQVPDGTGNGAGEVQAPIPKDADH